MFLASRIFRWWLSLALIVWIVLFVRYNDLAFLAEHWFYPAIMVLGAFVAGVTPEGGGVVAFPVLNIFIGIERTLALVALVPKPRVNLVSVHKRKFLAGTKRGTGMCRHFRWRKPLKMKSQRKSHFSLARVQNRQEACFWT